VVAANRWLAEQHAAHKLVPLDRLEVESGDPDEPASHATGRATIDWKQSRLTIKQRGRVLLERATPASWLAADQPMYPGAPPDEICHNPEFLSDAWIDVERRLAVLRVSYHGTDTCWEPPAQHHVVTW